MNNNELTNIILSVLDSLDIPGASLAIQYRRTTSFPIDSTSTWGSLDDATRYARNTDAEPYVPYDGQVISVEGEENIYVLVEDETISKDDGRTHFKLHKITTEEEATGKYLSRLVEDTAQKLIHFLEGIDAKGTSTFEIMKVLQEALFSDSALFEKNLSSPSFTSGTQGWSIFWKEFVNSAGVKELRTILEVDEINVRKAMRVYEMIVSQLLGENGTRLTTDMMEVIRIDKANNKIYLDTQSGKLYNPFHVGDCIQVQQFENGTTSKEYEFVVSGTGIGALDKNREDWVTYESFVGNKNQVTIGDTLVRVDSITNPDRKGMIKHTSVEAGSPYIDIVYGMKTDPGNSVRGRIGNLSGIVSPFWGRLKGFGGYFDNFYGRGDFMLRTGEDVLTKFQVTDANIRAEINSVRYDISEKDNYLKNASFVYDLTHWEHPTEVSVYNASESLLSVNRNLYSDKAYLAEIVPYNGQYMLRIKNSYIKQANADISKPAKEEKFYLSIQYLCKSSGTIKAGFTGKPLYVEQALLAADTFVIKSYSGNWDGTSDFKLEFDGDIYIKTLSLTTNPIESYKKEMETVLNAINGRIDAYVEKTDNLEETTTALGLTIDGITEELSLYYKKTDANDYINQQIGFSINGVNQTLENYYTSSEVDRLTLNIGNRIDGLDESLTLYANKTDLLERNYTDIGTRLSAAEGTLTNYAEFKSDTEGSLTQVNQKLDALEGSLETTVKDLVAGEVSGAAQDLAAQLYASSEDILSRIKGYSQDNRITAEEKTDINSIYDSIKTEISDAASDTSTPDITEANSPIISKVLSFLDEGINTGEAIKTNLRTAINTLKTKYTGLKTALFMTEYKLEENTSISYPLLSSGALQKASLLEAEKQIYPFFKEYTVARSKVADLGVEASREWIALNQSVISQTSQSIGLLVTKNDQGGHEINAASIIAAINDNGDSEIRLKADKISLEGYISDNNGFSIENGAMNALKGKIGGFGIDGANLCNVDNRDCWIAIEVEDKDGSVRTSSLGNNIPGIAGFKVAGYFGATGLGENIGLKLHAAKSKVYHKDYGGLFNLAIVATGGVDWRQSQPNDLWRMPGVLKCLSVRVNSDGGFYISNQFGMGLEITGINLDSTKNFIISHNRGNTNYYVSVLSSYHTYKSDWEETIPLINSKEDYMLALNFIHAGAAKVVPRFFDVIFYGYLT